MPKLRLDSVQDPRSVEHGKLIQIVDCLLRQLNAEISVHKYSYKMVYKQANWAEVPPGP